MVHCDPCGVQLDDDSRFCKYCGIQVAGTVATSDTKPKDIKPAVKISSKASTVPSSPPSKATKASTAPAKKSTAPPRPIRQSPSDPSKQVDIAASSSSTSTRKVLRTRSKTESHLTPYKPTTTSSSTTTSSTSSTQSSTSSTSSTTQSTSTEPPNTPVPPLPAPRGRELELKISPPARRSRSTSPKGSPRVVRKTDTIPKHSEKVGFLSIQEKSSWKKRYFVLSRGTLFCYKKQKDSSSLDLWILKDSKTGATPYTQKPHTFQIEYNGKCTLFQAATTGEMQSWIEALVANGATDIGVGNYAWSDEAPTLSTSPPSSKSVLSTSPSSSSSVLSTSPPSSSKSKLSRSLSKASARSFFGKKEPFNLDDVVVSAPVLVSKPNPIVAKKRAVL